MISFETLLNEIQKHVMNAKGVHDPQQIREQIIAIRALCDVAIAEQNTNNTVTNSQKIGENSTLPLQFKNASTLSSSKLKENDANGDSIFEF